jgi:isoleucyl-tRNA synthetase
MAEVCITSNAMVTNDDAPANAFTLADVPDVAVIVEKAVGTKCARSWKILPTVGEDAEYPDVSPRDAQALREWKALAAGEQPADAVEEAAEPVALVETPAIGQVQQPEEASVPAGSESVTAAKPEKKVRSKKPLGNVEAKAVDRPAKVEKVAAAKPTAEAEKPSETKTPKSKSTSAKKAKAKKAKARKSAAKKPLAKKAAAKKAAKSGKASSATKGAKRAATKTAAKKAKKKKATKKAAKKPPAAKVKNKAKKKKKKAR